MYENGPEFNLEAARHSITSSTKVPLSRVVLHLNDLVNVTSNATIATSDNLELPSLQNAGMKFLILLISLFGKSTDPDEEESSSPSLDTINSAIPKKPLLLDRYLSQIVPSIKHACISSSHTAIATARIPAAAADDNLLSAEGGELLFFQVVKDFKC